MRNRRKSRPHKSRPFELLFVDSEVAGLGSHANRSRTPGDDRRVAKRKAKNEKLASSFLQLPLRRRANGGETRQHNERALEKSIHRQSALWMRRPQESTA